MPKVQFTPNLERHLAVPAAEVAGETLREALAAVFAQSPKLESYVLDDQGRLRQHVVVFVNGRQATDRIGLSEAVSEDDEIYVMQALSGG